MIFFRESCHISYRRMSPDTRNHTSSSALITKILLKSTVKRIFAIRIRYTALHRITASQFIRRITPPAAYCFSQVKQGTSLIRLKNLCPIITKAEIFSYNSFTGILLYHFIDPVMFENIIPKLLHKRTWVPFFQHTHVYVTAVMKILDI